MHEYFRHALSPQPRVACLKLPLQPLTLGHLWLLQELNSPLINGEPYQFGDLLTAVVVCAQPHEQSRRSLRRIWWLSVFGWSVFGWYWGFRCRKLDLQEEAEKFGAYLEFEKALPPLQPVPGDKRRSIGAPWEWVLFDFLASTYGLSRREALNTPVRTANALWAVRGDAEGRVTLATATGGVAAAIKDIWRRRREKEATWH